MGVGEIGKSLYTLYKEKIKKDKIKTNNNKQYKNQLHSKLFLYDKKKIDVDLIREAIIVDDLSHITSDVLHVAIPFNKDFIDEVLNAIDKIKPSLVIINSTVPVGTTRKIKEKIPFDISVVHSPVIGIHPYLVKSLKTFKKIIGANTNSEYKKAKEEFNSIEIETVKFNSTEESELAKLLSTTYYGLIISFMEKVYDLCEKYNLSFENVYEKFNSIYNTGYKLLGKNEVVRPILKYMGKGIGGHCITSNAYILYKTMDIDEFVLPVMSAGYAIPDYLKDKKKYEIKDWLVAEYIGKNKGTKQIADDLGVYPDFIKDMLEKFDIWKI